MSVYAIEGLKNTLRCLRLGNVSVAENASARKIPRVVFWIGITSLLTDLATEMVGSVLPAFLFSVLLLPPLVIGFMEGVYQGAAAVLRLPAGIWADRFQKHKSVAAWGYGMSVIAKLGLLLSMQWGMLAALISLGLDRIGKAVRTAPRDVLIANHAEVGHIGAAFGLHRAMDALGALAGPLLAFAVFAWAPDDYSMLIGASLVIAICGLIAFVARVPGIRSAINSDPVQTEVFKNTDPKNISLPRLINVLRSQKSYWSFVLCVGAISLGVVSDGMLYLYLQQKHQMSITWLPLLYSGTAMVFVLTAYPLGKLADVVGAKWLVISGHGVVMVWYLCIPQLPAFQGIVGTVFTVGIFYAVTDGVLVTHAAKLLPPEVSTMGIAFLGAITGLMRLLSSTLFGALWQWYGQVTAFVFFSAILGVASIVTVISWPESEKLSS